MSLRGAKRRSNLSRNLEIATPLDKRGARNDWGEGVQLWFWDFGNAWSFAKDSVV